MIIEVRTYRIKPGRRAEFIRLFETRSVPAMRGYGMHVLGPLLCSTLWKHELEAIMMPMIDSYDVTLCETAPGCVFEIPR